jgi:hypothetical protein
MISFDKAKIKESLSTENIFDLLNEWGGDPEYTDFGILSSTICHNTPGDGSRKLYYYENSTLFKCYTGCDATFDIFELAIKVFYIQKNKNIDLNDAVRFVAAKFGLSGEYVIEENGSEDWKFLDNYERLAELEIKDYSVFLKEYDPVILERLNYSLILRPWLDEGIAQSAIDGARIGYYPGSDMITIPHFDADGRFIGLRGRSMAQDDVDRYGKYRPIKIMKQMYNHPLGLNLYNLNNSKNTIQMIGKAIVFESEKSCLLYQSYFPEADISVACCGSNISAHQIHMLLKAGAKEIIVAFDRQFQQIGDKEFTHLTTNLTKLHTKYKNDVQISFIFDKNMITGYKASPIDEGPEKFLQLFKERIIL